MSSRTPTGPEPRYRAAGLIASVGSGGQLLSRLQAEILELFEESNQAEEREITAYYRVCRFKYSLKAGGKFGKVKPVFFKPTVTGLELRAVHSDLKTLSLRKRGRSSYELRKLKKHRKLKAA